MEINYWILFYHKYGIYFFFEKCNNKYSLLNKITIILSQEDKYLHLEATAFLYLIENRKNILNNTEIQTIEFEWKCFKVQQEMFEFELEPSTTHGIFNYANNESESYNYNVESTKIIEYSCDLSQKSLGILYKNLINHFQKVVKFYNVTYVRKLAKHLPIVRCNLTRKMNLD